MSNEKIKKVTKENFKEIVALSEKPVLLDFWATWCGPCAVISPAIEQIADEREDIVVGKVNVDEQPELVQSFAVSSIPAIFVVKDGKIVKSAIGARGKAEILAMLG